MTRVFKRRDDEEWAPPRPSLPQLQQSSAPARPKPARPRVEPCAEPGFIHLDFWNDDACLMRATCDVSTRSVVFRAGGDVVASAVWTGSSFRDLRPVPQSPKPSEEAIRLIEEALVRAWKDVPVRHAAYTSPAEAIILGVQPIHQAPDAGSLGRELGDLREHKTLDIIRRALTAFAWEKSARRATAEEDADGKDVVIETDRGDLFAQIKSSRDAAREWRRKHGERLGPRAFVVLWRDGRPPSVTSIQTDLRRAYHALCNPAPDLSISPTPELAPAVRAPQSALTPTDRARILLELPAGLRCLFDANGIPLSGRGEPYLRALTDAYELALERDREKTERMRIFEESNHNRIQLQIALRIAVRALQQVESSEAGDALRALHDLDPYFVDERFLTFQPPQK
jgi:hypothetical protein